MDNKYRLDSFIAKPIGFLTLWVITIAAIALFKTLGIDNAGLILILLPSIVAIPLSLALNIRRIRQKRVQNTSSGDS